MSRPKLKELMPLFSAVIRGSPVGCGLPPFPEKFLVLKTPSDHAVLLRELGDGVVKYTNKEEFARAICRYTQQINNDDFLLTYEDAVKVANFWMSDPGKENILTKEPAAVLEKSEEGLCFHRLPFDADYTPGMCPLFEEFLDRCGNRRALATFIGSLFYPQADRQQYVWIYGEGRNGKGSLARLLRYFMGPSYLSEDANQASGRFWTSGLLGRRCVVFPDTNNVAFVQSGLFKSITGGDSVRVERKNQDSMNAVLSCKVFLMSNSTPQVSSQLAERRRIIFVPVDPITGEQDPEYEAKLLAEAPYILGAVKALYESECPKHEVIKVDESLTDELVDDFNEEFDMIFQKNFKLDVNASMRASEFSEILISAGIKELRKQGDFKKYLKNKYGIKKVRTTNGERCYPNLRRSYVQ